MSSFTLIISFLLVGYGFMTHSMFRAQKKVSNITSYSQYFLVSTMLIMFWPILITLPFLRTKKT